MPKARRGDVIRDIFTNDPPMPNLFLSNLDWSKIITFMLHPRLICNDPFDDEMEDDIVVRFDESLDRSKFVSTDVNLSKRVSPYG